MNNCYNGEKTYLKDYVLKIQPKLLNYKISANDVNNIIIILNYCFLKKNNFFVDNFNQSNIKPISIFYNQLKTNILMLNVIDIFDKITIEHLKPIKFVIVNLLNNYNIISDNNEELCNHISIENLKSILNGLNHLKK